MLQHLETWTYTGSPCPSCGVDLPGVGTSSKYGNHDKWGALIWCDHCDYVASGWGSNGFFAAKVATDKHQQAVRRSGWRKCNAA